MVFRKKLTDQEIVVVGAGEADEIDFDGDSTRARRRGSISDKIRISQEEKSIYDLVDGTMTVSDIVEVSRLSEFDTNKALYELLTRDLIEEVRGPSAAAVIAQATPVDETEVAATPVPLPLVVFLVALALVSVVTSIRNPLNTFRPVMGGLSPLGNARKAISMQRIELIGLAMDKYNDTHGQLPFELKELTPEYIDESLLRDPWGNTYKYIPRSESYLVIGYTPEGRPDTDLFLSRASEVVTATSSKPQTGGIRLVE
jgi:hypothetical protein